MKNYEAIFKAAKSDDRDTFRNLFFKLHTRDQEELYHALYPKNKQKIEFFLEPDEFTELFEWMDPRDQYDVYNVFSRQYIAGLLTHMESDNIVKFLSILNEEQKEELFSLLDQETLQPIREMLTFEPESAGSIMNKSYMTASLTETARHAASRLRASAEIVEMVYYIYVVNDAGELQGVVSLRDLLTSPEGKYLKDIMVTKLAKVNINDDQEVVAHLLQEYNLIAVPVVDDHGKMKGIITVDDVMDIMSQEVTEDFNDFAAINKSTKNELEEENAWDIARVRMPWIIILIFMGMISASLISSFEDTLNEVVLLAAFIPIIMDSAGNVGTQSLAVSVRKLSIGEDLFKNEFGKTIWRELLVGIIIGLAAGATLGTIVAIFYGNPVLGAIIAVSLLFTLSLSNVVGVIIPILANNFNVDPAVASGPFITTINDAVGLLIYFSIATRLLHLI